MNLLYVLAVKEDRSICPSYGVYKKVIAQINSLIRLGINAVLYEAPMLSKYRRVFPFASSSINWRRIPVDEKTDVLYIRHCFIDFQLVLKMKKIKSKYGNTKIILEIPSYPYEKESRKLNIKHIRDNLYSRLIHKYCDRIVTFSADKEIFGVKTIQLINGFDLHSVSKKEITGCKSINMCMVANFAPWHGIDRLIKGLISYYEMGGTRDISLTLIGADSPTLLLIKKLVSTSSISSRVFFRGALTGVELDKEYDKSNLGVECLALFRKGKNLISSSLKSREYLAKGIPFIYSGRIDIINDDFEYALSFPEEEGDISIQEIVSFFDSIYLKKKELVVIEKIREFAEETVSMDKTIKPLWEYINVER